MNSHLIDEILEAVWIAKEGGESTIENIVVDCAHDVGPYDLPASFEEMVSLNLLTIDGDLLNFTTAGENKARNLIRRHRAGR